MVKSKLIKTLIMNPLSKKIDKKIISWCLYDFANSSYSAVIAAVIFPVYYTTYIVGNETGFGDLWWGRAISVSMAFVALTSPFIGGMADNSGVRKRFLFIYTFISVLAVTSLSLLQKGMYFEGFLMIVIANIGLEGGLVFYNSYLPNIARKEIQGRVSGWGFAVGYAGSIISLIIALVIIKNWSINLVWLSVAIFFAIFSIPAFLYLPKDNPKGYSIYLTAIKGFKDTLQTFKLLLRHKEQRKFLLAYLIYEDGVNTVIVFSSIFAATTLGFKTDELIILYLIVQITALIGAFIMSKPIDTLGPKKVVMMSLLLWSSVSLFTYFVYSKTAFFIVASIAGLGLGTVQASSRAFFTQFIPHGKESEYFGLYALTGKTSAILGPLIFGTMSSLYGSQRPAALSVSAFFIIGLLIISTVKSGYSNIKPDKNLNHA